MIGDPQKFASFAITKKKKNNKTKATTQIITNTTPPTKKKQMTINLLLCKKYIAICLLPQILDFVGFSTADVQIGKTKVFLKVWLPSVSDEREGCWCYSPRHPKFLFEQGFSFG
jgi:hypothetical protein